MTFRSWIISGSGYYGPMSFKSWVISTSANFATWAFQPRIIRSSQFLLPGRFGPMTFWFLVIWAQELSGPVSCHTRVILLPGHFGPWSFWSPDNSAQSFQSPVFKARKKFVPSPGRISVQGHFDLVTCRSLDILGSGHIASWTFRTLEFLVPGYLTFNVR